jgi:hypothetical protein
VINAREDDGAWRFLSLEKEDLLHQSQRLVVGPSRLMIAILTSAVRWDNWRCTKR